MAIAAIKSSFNQIIVLDTGESIQVNAGETDFMKITVSDGKGNSASFPMDVTVGPLVSRIIQLLDYTQVEVKR